MSPLSGFYLYVVYKLNSVTGTDFPYEKNRNISNRELCLKKHFPVSEMDDCNPWSAQVSALVTHSVVELM